MSPTSEPFRFLFRVRYHECDAQKIVFNARYGEYVDIAATEYTRAMFGAAEPDAIAMDWRLVRQLTEWKSPARFDDVIEARVSTARVGSTSFTLATELRRAADGALLVRVETVYVVIDPIAGTKRAIPEERRPALAAGAPGVVVDHAGFGHGAAAAW